MSNWPILSQSYWTQYLQITNLLAIKFVIILIVNIWTSFVQGCCKLHAHGSKPNKNILKGSYKEIYIIGITVQNQNNGNGLTDLISREATCMNIWTVTF
jgi:hypothetical protein